MTTAPIAPEAAVPVPAAKPIIRHRLLVRLTHWLNAVFLTGMIASGLQIYTAYAHIGYHGDTFRLPNPFDASRLAVPSQVQLGGWLAGGLRWHFTLAWPFALTGLAYVLFLAISGEWRALLFRPSDVPQAWQMMRYYLRLRPDHPAQGKHNALQKSAYTFALVLAVISILTGFALAKPIQLGFLTTLFGGYELTRYWHFVAVWTFTAFIVAHVIMVFVADPASLRAIITGRYRGKFTSNE
ncbi:MAG TPA: cytochrome b/b6 domain-containing protein [Gemmatimonadales bacterium]|jgi:thiosulfate reductase cytochrome b subunit|nr:cytochrome b/b6 domain-containing protein [Gemmatimonadales bacterium]